MKEADVKAARRCADLITADVKLWPDCGIDGVQSISSERPLPVPVHNGSSAEVMMSMPGCAMFRKPISAEDGIDRDTRLERRDQGE